MSVVHAVCSQRWWLSAEAIPRALPHRLPLPLMPLIPCANQGESKAQSSGRAFLWLYCHCRGAERGHGLGEPHL